MGQTQEILLGVITNQSINQSSILLTSISCISSVSLIESTVRAPWLMKLYRAASGVINIISVGKKNEIKKIYTLYTMGFFYSKLNQLKRDKTRLSYE